MNYDASLNVRSPVTYQIQDRGPEEDYRGGGGAGTWFPHPVILLDREREEEEISLSLEDHDHVLSFHGAHLEGEDGKVYHVTVKASLTLGALERLHAFLGFLLEG